MRDRSFAVRLEMGFAMMRLDDESMDLHDADRSIMPDDAEDLELLPCEPDSTFA